MHYIVYLIFRIFGKFAPLVFPILIFLLTYWITSSLIFSICAVFFITFLSSFFQDDLSECIEKGMIPRQDKKVLDNILATLLKGGNLANNFVCLLFDLRNLSFNERREIIEKLKSEDNCMFTDKEASIIHCIISKILYDYASTNMQTTIVEAMRRHSQKAEGVLNYGHAYLIIKESILKLSFASLRMQITEIVSCKEKKDFINVLGDGWKIFMNYIKSMESFLKNPKENNFSQMMNNNMNIIKYKNEKNSDIQKSSFN